MSKTNTIGVIRTHTQKYFEYRKHHSANISLKAKSLNDSAERDLNKQTLTGNQSAMELQHYTLPPKYVEIFDETCDIIREFHVKLGRLQEEQQKRIMPKFNDEENVKSDRIIAQFIRDLTGKIKTCEENLRLIAHSDVKKEEEKYMKENMRIHLVDKVKDITSKLRQNNDQYLKKYAELVGVKQQEKYFNPNLNSTINNSFSTSSKSGGYGGILEVDSNTDILRKRDTEINNLVNSIEELGGIFKDLQSLVFEQGTILDRIDYNIEKAIENTKEANKDLKEAEQTEKNSCAKKAIIGLIILIGILAILLIVKYFS